MADEKLTAATRLEKLLDNIAGGENEVTPATRLEKFLSYIADAMEGGGGSGGGGCENCVKILTVETYDTSEHGLESIYLWSINGEWVDVQTDYHFVGIDTTENDIPNAYFTNLVDIGTCASPSDINYGFKNDFVTSETHTPGAADSAGYYVEYADDYSFCVFESPILILKNPVITYHRGLD